MTDIAYIKTFEGFAYLAVVIDLFSRRTIGWSLQSRQTGEVVLEALHMAIWRRKPQNTVLVHSDQGSQFTSMGWASFLRRHNLTHSMSRRGDCHDNAVAESFFNLLKRERIRRRTYRTRDEARQDVFDYIEMFYNPARKHVRNGMCRPSSSSDATRHNPEGVYKTRCYSAGADRHRQRGVPEDGEGADRVISGSHASEPRADFLDIGPEKRDEMPASPAMCRRSIRGRPG